MCRALLSAFFSEHRSANSTVFVERGASCTPLATLLGILGVCFLPLQVHGAPIRMPEASHGRSQALQILERFDVGTDLSATVVKSPALPCQEWLVRGNTLKLEDAVRGSTGPVKWKPGTLLEIRPAPALRKSASLLEHTMALLRSLSQDPSPASRAAQTLLFELIQNFRDPKIYAVYLGPHAKEGLRPLDEAPLPPESRNSATIAANKAAWAPDLDLLVLGFLGNPATFREAPHPDDNGLERAHHQPPTDLLLSWPNGDHPNGLIPLTPLPSSFLKGPRDLVKRLLFGPGSSHDSAWLMSSERLGPVSHLFEIRPLRPKPTTLSQRGFAEDLAHLRNLLVFAAAMDRDLNGTTDQPHLWNAYWSHTFLSDWPTVQAALTRAYRRRQPERVVVPPHPGEAKWAPGTPGPLLLQLLRRIPFPSPTESLPTAEDEEEAINSANDFLSFLIRGPLPQKWAREFSQFLQESCRIQTQNLILRFGEMTGRDRDPNDQNPGDHNSPLVDHLLHTFAVQEEWAGWLARLPAEISAAFWSTPGFRTSFSFSNQEERDAAHAAGYNHQGILFRMGTLITAPVPSSLSSTRGHSPPLLLSAFDALAMIPLGKMPWFYRQYVQNQRKGISFPVGLDWLSTHLGLRLLGLDAFPKHEAALLFDDHALAGLLRSLFRSLLKNHSSLVWLTYAQSLGKGTAFTMIERYARYLDTKAQGVSATSREIAAFRASVQEEILRGVLDGEARWIVQSWVP